MIIDFRFTILYYAVDTDLYNYYAYKFSNILIYQRTKFFLALNANIY